MIISTVTGIAGLILALNGWLYQPKKNPDGPSSWRNYTPWGKLLLLLIIFVNATAIVTGYYEGRAKTKAAEQAALEVKERDARIAKLQITATTAAQAATGADNRVAKMEGEIASYQIKLGDAISKATELGASNANLQGKIETYQEFIRELRKQSDRQPQMVMAQYVTLRPDGKWSAPNRIYSGSIVEFFDWPHDVILRYGETEQRVAANPYPQNSRRVAIVGDSGAELKWTLTNGSGRSENHGKVFVYSTPRTRSVDWSWLDEQIQTLAK